MPFTELSSFPTPTPSHNLEGSVPCESEDNLAFLSEIEPPTKPTPEYDNTMILETILVEVVV